MSLGKWKADEYRVAILPFGVEELTRAGHRILIEAGAGQGSGIPDEDYAVNGAEIVDSPEAVFGEGRSRRQSQRATVGGVASAAQKADALHLLSLPRLMRNSPGMFWKRRSLRLLMKRCEGAKGDLPLLTPMSEVAGRMSIQEGAKYLERPQEGRGILLGGVPGVMPAEIVVLGGGVVGKNAAQIAAGFQSRCCDSRHQRRPPKVSRRHHATEREHSL